MVKTGLLTIVAIVTVKQLPSNKIADDGWGQSEIDMLSLQQLRGVLVGMIYLDENKCFNSIPHFSHHSWKRTKISPPRCHSERLQPQ